MYALLQSHKCDITIKVSNLIWLLTLYAPRDSSFISTQFLVMNLNVSSSMCSIIMLYCYINLRSSIIFCLCSRDIYLSLCISLSSSTFSSSFVTKLLWGEAFETLVILSAILFPIKSPVASAVFLNCSFWRYLEPVAYCLAWLRSSWLYLLLKFYLCFYQYFFLYFYNHSQNIWD